MQTFIQSLESRIGNHRKPLYDTNNPKWFYYISFDGDIKDDNVDLTYGYELIDVKVEEIYDAYIDALDDYIGAKVFIPGIYTLLVLRKVRNHKWGSYGNTIGEKNSNPILYHRIYDLDDNLSDQADPDGWDTDLID